MRGRERETAASDTSAVARALFYRSSRRACAFIDLPGPPYVIFLLASACRASAHAEKPKRESVPRYNVNFLPRSSFRAGQDRLTLLYTRTHARTHARARTHTHTHTHTHAISTTSSPRPCCKKTH